MRVYHAEKTSTGRLLEMLHDISFVYNKGLLKNCTTLIERATKLAYETEQHSMILLLNDYLIDLFKQKKLDDSYTTQALQEEERKVLQDITSTRMATYMRIRMVEIDARALWASCAAEVEQIKDQALLMSRQQGLTHKAEGLLLNTLQYYYLHYLHYQDCLDITAQWLSKYEQNEYQQQFMSESYRLALANYMHSALMCEKLELIPPGIQKIKAIKPIDEREAAVNFRLIAQYELIYLLNTSPQTEANTIIAEIDAGLVKYVRFIPENNMVDFQFNIILLFFVQKKYSEVLIRSKKFYTYAGRMDRHNMSLFLSKMMEWMCQCSLDNYDILDSSLRNLKRYYKDKNNTSEFLDAVFALFATIVREGGSTRKSKVSEAITAVSNTPPPTEWVQLKTLILSWI